jgi:CubicO group peptidase (beta-lactamase class C family)
MTKKSRLAAWLLAMCAASAGAQPLLLPERIEKAAQDRIAAGACRTLVFAVVDGNLSEVRAFGALDDGKPPDGDTVYEIGSITKTFTATLLAEAVQAGHVTLDTPLQKLLPDFRIPARHGRQITLGEIGTQHSGLPRLPANLQPKDTANPYADYDAARAKAFLAGYELSRDPGSSYEYSNLAFGLLGYALAQSANKTYGALTEQEILQPLLMTMSGTALTDEMRAHLAPGHDEDGHPAENWDFDALAGAGAIRSTANDMLRYLKANMGPAAGPLALAMKSAQAPLASLDGHARIGLAWMTTDKGIVWHNGGTGGYRSFIGWSSDKQHGVVILSNSAVELDDLGFATLLADAPLAPAHKAVALQAASLDPYAGTYALSDRFRLKVFRAGDQLQAQATGQGAFPIYASGPDEFFARIASIGISFVRDAKGDVSGLVLHQNGDHPARKLSAAELPPEPKAIELDAATLGSYVGKYDFGIDATLAVTLRDGQLEAKLGAQPAFPIFPSARDKFFYRVVDAQLEFERDGNGKVIAVILHQDGHDQRASSAAR